MPRSRPQDHQQGERVVALEAPERVVAHPHLAERLVVQPEQVVLPAAPDVGGERVREEARHVPRARSDPGRLPVEQGDFGVAAPVREAQVVEAEVGVHEGPGGGTRERFEGTRRRDPLQQREDPVRNAAGSLFPERGPRLPVEALHAVRRRVRLAEEGPRPPQVGEAGALPERCVKPGRGAQDRRRRLGPAARQVVAHAGGRHVLEQQHEAQTGPTRETTLRPRLRILVDARGVAARHAHAELRRELLIEAHLALVVPAVPDLAVLGVVRGELRDQRARRVRLGGVVAQREPRDAPDQSDAGPQPLGPHVQHGGALRDALFAQGPREPLRVDLRQRCGDLERHGD